MIKKISIMVILLVLFLSACQTENTQTPAAQGEAFELFLVTDPQISGADIQNYDLNELPLAEEPLIATENIEKYDWETHTIYLTDDAYQKILSVFSGSMRMSGVPFVIVSTGERIYAGAFWSLASSLSFDGVVILQPFDPAGMPLFINLGYPSPDFFTGEDPRANPRLLQALEDAEVIRE